MGVGAPNVLGTSIVTMTNNLLSHNRFGIIVEAGFPVPGGSLRGDARITTSGNVFTANCQADFYASFARHATGLGLNANPYMKNATYAMTFGSDVPMSSVWYANPAGNGNTLTVNGATIPNGIVTAYDAAKVCP